MSVAKYVRDCEPNGVASVTIEDDSGNVWRYNRTEEIAATAEPHVVWEPQVGNPRKLKLAHREDGQAVLRQDEPGLPERIIVEIIDGVVTSPVLGGWKGLFVYGQEGHG